MRACNAERERKMRASFNDIQHMPRKTEKEIVKKGFKISEEFANFCRTKPVSNLGEM